MRLCFTIMATLLIGTTAAHAQDWPRFEALLGAQVAAFQTDVTLNAGATIEGTPIDFETALGLKENSRAAWASGLWRISRRNHVEVGWNKADRSVVQRPLPSHIRFGEETFETDAEVDAFFNTWFVGASYRFALVTTPVVELGPVIGVIIVNLSTGIELSGSESGSGGDVSEDAARDATLTAPAVLPGAFITLHAHPRLTIRGRGGYVSADFGNIDGQVLMIQIGAEVKFSRWLGVGGTYAYNRLSVAAEDSDFKGSIRYRFSGPQIYAVLAF